VLAFPCNQFNNQEPGTNAEVLEFAQTKYGVSFPMHAKIEVNGDGAHPLYVYLRNQAKGLLGTTAIKWNFTKFLVDRGGKVVDRFGPPTTPSSMTGRIEALLG
jgi:glutathione peroxidase